MDGGAGRRDRTGGPGTGALPVGAVVGGSPSEQHRLAVLGQHRLCEHHRTRSGRALTRQPGNRRTLARLHALERHGHGGQGQPPSSGGRWRPGRSHRFLCVAGQPVRCGLQPLLACRVREPRWRLPFHPGSCVAWRLCPCVPGRPLVGGAVAELPPGGGWQGALQLPAPQADARVLAVPHGVDGPGPADGDLPGALPEVPARPGHRQHREPQSLGVLWRRRNGRGRVARRHRSGRS